MKKNVTLLVILILTLFVIITVYFLISKNNVVTDKLASKNIAITNEISTNTRSVSYDYEKYKNLPINYTHAVYEYDTSTPEQAIGVADYAFIAKVNNIVRTEYRYPMEAVIDGEIKTVTIPYTVYSITVIENIKGELLKTKDIEVMQYGGLEEDTKSYSFHEGMNLLNVGEYYILLVYASSEDGTLLIDSQDSVVSLGSIEENTLTVVKNNVLPEVASRTINKGNISNQKPGSTPMDIVAKYTQAAQNPIVPANVEVTKSKLYDVNLSK